jgi:hypothetical protein
MTPERWLLTVKNGVSKDGAMALHVPRLPFSLDPLLAEAKRRMRRRRVLVAIVSVGFAGASVGATLALRAPSGASQGGVSYPTAGIVPQGVREIDIVSAFPEGPLVAQRRVTDPATVVRIVRLIDALSVFKATYSGVCPAIEGPTATLEMLDGSGDGLAGASVVTGDGGGISPACNPVLFSRGEPASPGRGLQDPQAALAGRTVRQARFVQRLERLIGTSLSSRS